MRVDGVRPEDCIGLARGVRAELGAASADVVVLGEGSGHGDGVTVPAERAVELRNRKQRLLMLLVPVGAGAAASSLDNSFERHDVAELLRAVGDRLAARLDPEMRHATTQVGRVLGRTRPVETWARYLADVVEDPEWRTVGARLWMVGLVPDVGGESLLGRLSDNARCAKEISRPLRAVASVPDRVTKAGLEEGPARDRIVAYLSRTGVDLSDAAGWAAPLAVEPYVETLSFEHWPLAQRRPENIRSLRVDPFLKEDGTLRAGTRLKQDSPGDPPYAEAGPESPASLKLVWRTDPPTTEAIHRWRLEVLPPDDLRDQDTEPLRAQTVKGDKRQAIVHLPLAEEDLDGAGLLLVRVTALDSAGQTVLLADHADAVQESQQFVVRWDSDPLPARGRRSSTPSIAHARLEAALDGQDDLGCDAPSWDDPGTFSFRLGGRRGALLAVSPALAAVQRMLCEDPARAVAWEASGRLGEVLATTEITPVQGALPPTLAERRRHLLAQLAERAPYDVVEALDWDAELREEVRSYCQTYRRALDAAADEDARLSLLSLDTMTLSVATAGHEPIAAVIVLPLHPIRIAWLAGHDETLRGWVDALRGAGPARERRRSVDVDLARRVAPANLPFAVYGVDGSPFVYIREATLGTGIYLHPGEAEPGAAVEAVLNVLGLARVDVAAQVPPRIVGERVDAYRVAHPGQESLQILAYNAGSGELLSGALRTSVFGRPSDEDQDDVPESAEDVQVVAYSRRPSFTDPLPALTDLQREVAARTGQGARSHLVPPLGISVREDGCLASDTSAAHLGVLADLAVVEAGGQTDYPEMAASFRNLLTPASNRRFTSETGVAWRTAPALRSVGRDGAADAVDAHRSYQTALAAALGHTGRVVLTAWLGTNELASLRAAHDRADWVLTVDRNLGLDLYTSLAGTEAPYLLDYAPDFLEGLGPRLTVTTTRRDEVYRLLADAMSDLHLAAVADSVRDILAHLQVVSGRLAMRLVGRSTLATEAVSLAALMAYLRTEGRLADTIVVPVDAHQEMFGDVNSESGARRCDVILVRCTSRTLRMECVEVKSRRAAALPAALVGEIVDQLDATVSMLRDTYFRTDPPRIDAELQRARLAGVLRHHANRAHVTGLLDDRRRADAERLFERVEDGSLVPDIERRGYVVSLAGDGATFPREHRGVPIRVLTAADLGSAGFTSTGKPSPDQVPPRPVDVSPGLVPRSEESPSGAAASSTEVGATGSHRQSAPQAGRPSPRPRPVTLTAVPGRSSSPPNPSLLPEPGNEARQANHAQPDAEASSTPDDSAATTAEVVAAPADPANPPASVAEQSWPAEVDVVLGHDAHASDVRWRISTAGSPHMFVLGIPGQGKSVTTRRVLNGFAAQRLPALVLDFHGDMAAAPPAGATVLDASQGLEISPFEMRDDNHRRYPEAAWELSEVVGFVCGLGEIQQNAVYEAARELYRAHGFGSESGPTGLPSMEELAAAIVESERAGRGRNVAARLRPLTDFGLFVDRAGPGFASLLSGGVVIDVHNLMEQVQVAAGAFVLRKVYREMFRWGQSRSLRLAVVLDEAHRLAKDVTLPKIMKEGRKYGVSVVAASQGVDDFHRDVLGNAGTKVAFRCNFPQSKTVGGFLRGRAGQNMSVALEGLDVGQAYVSTPDRAEARKVYMARD
ncbi:DUF87 domain-containing protein [Actinomycetospora chibensis]|nr:DUF87 domain-containing protein [Actinomycetospora chibensis]